MISLYSVLTITSKQLALNEDIQHVYDNISKRRIDKKIKLIDKTEKDKKKVQKLDLKVNEDKIKVPVANNKRKSTGLNDF